MGVWFLFATPLTTCRRFGIHWVDTLVICVYLKDGISPKALYNLQAWLSDTREFLLFNTVTET